MFRDLEVFCTKPFQIACNRIGWQKKLQFNKKHVGTIFLLWKTQEKVPGPHGKIHKLLNKFGIILCTSVHTIIFIYNLWSLMYVRDHKNERRCQVVVCNCTRAYIESPNFWRFASRPCPSRALVSWIARLIAWACPIAAAQHNQIWSCNSLLLHYTIEPCMLCMLRRLVLVIALAGGVAAAFGQLLLCLHLLCVCPKLVWYATCARPRGRESEPKPFSCGVNVAYIMLQRAAPKEITMLFEVLSLTTLPTRSIGN